VRERGRERDPQKRGQQRSGHENSGEHLEVNTVLTVAETQGSLPTEPITSSAWWETCAAICLVLRVVVSAAPEDKGERQP